MEHYWSYSYVKEKHGLLVISLNMPGSAASEADLIVTDPIQAGVMAVMAIANTAVLMLINWKIENIDFSILFFLEF